MPRTLKIVAPSHRTEELLDELRSKGTVLGLQLQRGGSLQPAGDVISVTLTTRSLHAVMQVLVAAGIGADSSSSAQLDHPQAVLSRPEARRIASDVAEGIWEEMDAQMAKESNVGWNGVVTMAAAGALASLGLHQGTLHLVLGGMMIAPGFEPLARTGMALASASHTWRQALRSAAVNYAALLIGSVAMTLVLMAFGKGVGDMRGYLSAQEMVTYWTGVRLGPIVVAILGGVAGAIVIAAGRSVLTAGIMATLALVPSLTLVGMALARWDMQVLFPALWRWIFDVVTVFAASFVVFAIKRARVHQRPSLS